MLRADRALHHIPCTAQITLPYIPLTGFNAAGNNIVFAACQQGFLVSINGALWAQTNYSNYSSFATVFQEYRIMQFSVEVFCSVNTAVAPASTSGGQFFPMLYSCVDREDAVAVTSVNDVLQYASCEVTQLGSAQGPKTTVCVGPSAFAAYDNASTIVGTITATGAARSPWLACGTNSSTDAAAVIPHGYIKYFVDNLGSSLSQSIMAVSFIVRTSIQYRGID
jgi:hypothetical protein